MVQLHAPAAPLGIKGASARSPFPTERASQRPWRSAGTLLPAQQGWDITAGPDGKLSFPETRGRRAQFKGSGTINGTGDYRFLLTAIDGQEPGGGGADRFRIKIWARNPDGSDGGIVYDNQMGAGDTGNDATELGAGSIVIHR